MTIYPTRQFLVVGRNFPLEDNSALKGIKYYFSLICFYTPDASLTVQQVKFDQRNSSSFVATSEEDSRIRQPDPKTPQRTEVYRQTRKKQETKILCRRKLTHENSKNRSEAKTTIAFNDRAQRHDLFSAGVAGKRYVPYQE